MEVPPGKGKFIWLGLFAAAMGLLEAIVVVYLRELYYPSGFAFPLKWIPPEVLLAEILREACTILMLAALAAVAARGFYMRLAYFLFVFGLWDVFYYVGLKLLLGWPPSLLTWDILFLIPVTWVGPVLAPLLAALTMLLMSLLVSRLIGRYNTVRAGPAEWGLIVLGAFLIFLTFIWDCSGIIIEGGFLGDLPGLGRNREFQEALSAYVPERYQWGLFALGEALILYAMAMMYKRTERAGLRPG
jgi:hypothetical protein